jgi:CheY-like chemotaxis protein
LASLGHEACFAGSGGEALERLPTDKFDLVLMDLQMPHMDGFATARAMRSMPGPLGQVPIFALTASVMPEQIAAAHEAGMNGHIGKPLSRDTLANALSALLQLPALNAGASIDNHAPTAKAPLDTRALELLKTELKGAAAGVVREFMVEMHTIRDQFAAELAQAFPQPDVIAQNAHRLLGAARTLGALRLAAQLNEFQKSQPRDGSVLHAQNTEALERVIAETDVALENLEAFFQARLVGTEASV